MAGRQIVINDRNKAVFCQAFAHMGTDIPCAACYENAVHQYAPLENITAGIVLRIKRRSCEKERVSAYIFSRRTRSSNEISLRPDICQIPVNPGLTERILSVLSPYHFRISWAKCSGGPINTGGRGPAMLKS